MKNGSGVETILDLRTETLTDEAALDQTAKEWDCLLEASDQRVYFLGWSWNRAWWSRLKPADAQLFLIACRDAENRLVGLAPFYLRQRRTAGIPHVRELLFLGTGIHTQTSEYLDIVARRGYENAVAGSIARFLRESKDWDRLWLNEIPASSVVLPHLIQALGSGPQAETCNRSRYVDTNQTWDDFKRSLSKNTRNNLSYYTRRMFNSYDCEFRLVETSDELNIAMEALVRLHQARWESRGEPGSFAIAGFEDFLKDAMRASLQEGRLRLWTLLVNEKVTAALVGFYDNGVVHNFQGGFDPAYSKDCPGNVLVGLCIKACIEDREVSEFDFMGGDDAYKERWTKLRRENKSLTFLRPGRRSMIYKAIEQTGQIGKPVLKAVLPAPVRLRLRRLMSNA